MPKTFDEPHHEQQEAEKWRDTVDRLEQQVTERDVKIAGYEEVLRLIYNNSGWLLTDENRWLLQRLEQAVEMIKK